MFRFLIFFRSKLALSVKLVEFRKLVLGSYVMALLVCNRFEEILYDPEYIFKSKIKCVTPLLEYFYGLLSARIF